MNLIFIHGRSQGGKNAEQLKNDWLSALTTCWKKNGIKAPAINEVKLPYYADILDDHTSRTKPGIRGILSRGSNDEGGDDLDEDDLALVRELLIAADVPKEALENEFPPGVVERGAQNWEWFQAACRALSKRAKWLADFGIDNFTGDVSTYLKNPLARDEIDDLVASTIQERDCVVVAHSLGTVVAYNVLRHKIANVRIPMLLTLGSPLGLPSIKRQLAPPALKFPKPPAEQWVNALDERDFIALHSKLGKSFVNGIVDLNHVDNGEDAHSIIAYLSDKLVARQIADAFG